MTEQRRPRTAAVSKTPDRTRELESLVGTCDYLKVTSVIEGGAFLYCGRSKDLFVPIGQQQKIMKVGEFYLVYVYRDEKTGRVAGSSKLNNYLFDDGPDGMKEGDQVDLIVYSQTDMGYKVVVNHDSWGLLYKNEVFQDLRVGRKIKGFIKKIRPDGRIDVSLQKPGEAVVPLLADRILAHLKTCGGSAPLTDKTPPEEIYRLFGASKKKFKEASGNLYKQRRIVLGPKGMKLVEHSHGGKI